MRTSAHPTIIQKAVASLKPHPMLDRVTILPDVVAGLRKVKVKKPEHRAAADEIAEDWEAFKASLDEVGLQEPLKVLAGTDEVVDGRNRLRAATELGWKNVACIEVSEDEARKIIESSVIGRRSWSKGQRAYLAVLMHPEVSENKRGGDRKSDHSDSVGMMSRGALAKRFGVSADLIDQACKLYAAFEGSKSLRIKHEQLVWAGFGLGGILAGLAGHEATHQKSIRQQNLTAGLFRRLTAFGGSIAQTWDKVQDEDQRMFVGEALGTFLGKLPPELREIARARLADDPEA